MWAGGTCTEPETGGAVSDGGSGLVRRPMTISAAPPTTTSVPQISIGFRVNVSVV